MERVHLYKSMRGSAVLLITDTDRHVSDREQPASKSLAAKLKSLGFSLRIIRRIPLEQITATDLLDCQAIFITGGANLATPPQLPKCLFESNVPILADDFGFISLAAHFGQAEFSGSYGYTFKHLTPTMEKMGNLVVAHSPLFKGVKLGEGVWMSNLVMYKAPIEFKVLAREEKNNSIAAMKHNELPIYAVQCQLHGISRFGTPYCQEIIRNFLDLTGVLSKFQHPRSLMSLAAAE
jgi:anthranilate/para-aminobenzoate synthase component II